MNIALLHYAAPPVVGGVESVLAHHARLMAQAGHSVRVVAGRGQTGSAPIEWNFQPLMDSRHPEVLAVKAALDAGAVTPGFANLREALTRALEETWRSVEVVVAHNVCSLHKNLALTAALHELSRAAGAPRLLLWHHDLAWATPRYRAELHEGYPWNLLREAAAWPTATHVTISEQRRRELAALTGLAPERITVIPNGVDWAAFHKLEPQTQTLFDALGLAEAEPLLLLPARLTPRKNIELALRVLAELRREWPRARLLVTGPEGPHNPANAAYKQTLLALRAELDLRNVAHFVAEHTAAFLPEVVIADFFRVAHALFLPSRDEGFGIPLIEAALSRLPVFCADLPALREVGGAEAIYFAPESSPASVAALITQHLRANAAFRWAARAQHQFSWEAIYATHIAPLLAKLECQ